MNPFYITARDEFGGYYDATSYATIEDAQDALSSLYDALEDATVRQSYKIKVAIQELEDQLAEALSD